MLFREKAIYGGESSAEEDKEICNVENDIADFFYAQARMGKFAVKAACRPRPCPIGEPQVIHHIAAGKAVIQVGGCTAGEAGGSEFSEKIPGRSAFFFKEHPQGPGEKRKEDQKTGNAHQFRMPVKAV